MTELEIHEGIILQHFKGNYYEVISVGLHSETSEKMVIYKEIEGPNSVIQMSYEAFLLDPIAASRNASSSHRPLELIDHKGIRRGYLGQVSLDEKNPKDLDDTIWVRPLTMFYDEVIVEGEVKTRFKNI